MDNMNLIHVPVPTGIVTQPESPRQSIYDVRQQRYNTNSCYTSMAEIRAFSAHFGCNGKHLNGCPGDRHGTLVHGTLVARLLYNNDGSMWGDRWASAWRPRTERMNNRMDTISSRMCNISFTTRCARANMPQDTIRREIVLNGMRFWDASL